jgi:drug/metabolite transporter (DMT)-like permease
LYFEFDLKKYIERYGDNMNLDTKKSLLGDLSLFIVAIIWGGGFVAVKDALNSVTPFYIMALRLTCAAILLGLIFFKTIKKIDKQDIIGGSIVGIFLFTGFAAQTIGLQYTTAGKQAFLTTVYVVIVPFFSWKIDKKKPDFYSIFSTFLALIGIGFLNIGDGLTLNMNIGDWLTLICAFLFAAHIIAVSHYAKKVDPIILSVVQMLFAGLVSLVCALIFEPKFAGISSGAFFSVFYLIVFSTMLAFLVQNVAQKYTHPNHVGIILCLESVFGAILSVLILKEIFTVYMIIGCVIIFVALIISETKLSFLKTFIKKEIPLSDS